MNTLKCKHGFKTSICRRAEHEAVVKNGLSVTPSQMMDLTNQGLSISSQNLRYLNSVDPADKDFYVPLQYRRGVDLVDLSDHSNDLRAKLKFAMDSYDRGEISDISNLSNS